MIVQGFTVILLDTSLHILFTNRLKANIKRNDMRKHDVDTMIIKMKLILHTAVCIHII
jgi:hypothetical protein